MTLLTCTIRVHNISNCMKAQGKKRKKIIGIQCMCYTYMYMAYEKCLDILINTKLMQCRWEKQKHISI